MAWAVASTVLSGERETNALGTARSIAAASSCSVKPRKALLKPMSQARRRYPIGAELVGENQTHFRVWAPKVRELEVVLENFARGSRKCWALSTEPGGYFAGATDASAVARYWFRINDTENLYPDPASRFQPDGPHGSSCIVDPTRFQWNDATWPGLKLKGQIIYEMHIGT